MSRFPWALLPPAADGRARRVNECAKHLSMGELSRKDRQRDSWCGLTTLCSNRLQSGPVAYWLHDVPPRRRRGAKRWYPHKETGIRGNAHKTKIIQLCLAWGNIFNANRTWCASGAAHSCKTMGAQRIRPPISAPHATSITIAQAFSGNAALVLQGQLARRE